MNKPDKADSGADSQVLLDSEFFQRSAKDAVATFFAPLVGMAMAVGMASRPVDRSQPQLDEKKRA